MRRDGIGPMEQTEALSREELSCEPCAAVSREPCPDNVTLA